MTESVHNSCIKTPLSHEHHHYHQSRPVQSSAGLWRLWRHGRISFRASKWHKQVIIYEPCHLCRVGNVIRNCQVIKSDKTTEETSYDDCQPVESSNFESKSARLGFIQKVLSILTIQVVVGFCLINLSAVNWLFNYWIHERHILLMIISCSTYLATLVLPFQEHAKTRQKPYSIILLVINPLSFAFGAMVFATAYLHAEIELLFAWSFYGLMMLALLIYSVFCLHTTMDFQASKGLFIITCLQVYLYNFSCLTVSCAFTSNLHLLYLTLLVFLDCVNRLYHLNKMTRGEYRFPITPGDYIWAALHVNIDVGNTCAELARKLRAKLCV